MGITQQSLNRLTPYLKPHIHMLELGAQNMYDNGHYGWIAKDYFESINIHHISVDIIEHQGCVQCDLRELHPFNAKNDIVTNFGTAEHVDGSLYNPFKNIHNACKVDGIMIHENPKTGNWPSHGQHYFTMGFYPEFAMACGYQVVELTEEPAMGNVIDGWNVSCVLKKLSDNEFITEEQFNKIYDAHIFSK